MVGEGLDHVPRLFVLSLVHYISRKTFRMLMRDECVFESEKKGDSTGIEPESPWRESGMVTTRPGFQTVQVCCQTVYKPSNINPKFAKFVDFMHDKKITDKLRSVE